MRATSGNAKTGLIVVLVGGTIVGSCSGTARRPAETRPPNVILISLDTLRADRLNTHGYDRHPTSPLIDALGRDGIVHEAHIASSPWTIPSHLSLLTSLHPAAHGAIRGVGHLVLGEDVAHFERLGAAHVTLGEALADAGYRTAAFTGGVTLDPRIGFDQGFELYTTNMGKISAAQMGPMLRWLAAEPGRPFFLFWHSFEVHAPYTRGRFLPASLSGLRKDLEGLTRELADEAVFASRWRGDDLMTDLLVRHGVDNAETWSDLYDGGIAAADFWVGRLVAYLLDHDLYDSTMIVLTSDHGEELADHDPETFRGWHGHSVYEELLWVPLVVKLPGSEHAGLRIDAVTSGVDVMPTVLDVAGVEGPRARMQGKSLVGLWTGAREADRVAFSEAAAYAEEFKSVRGPRFKLVFEIGPETVARHGRAFAPRVPARRLLFDLSVDPREQRNLLAGTPSRRAEFLAADLETKLRAFVTAEPGEVEEITLDEEALERLRAMGYIP